MSTFESIFIQLELLADVVQTASSATEGAHESLDCIRGATLLGAVASMVYAQLAPEDAFAVFHSGRVRFGDAVPLVNGRPAATIPLSWYRAKADPGTGAQRFHVRQSSPSGAVAEQDLRQARSGRFTEADASRFLRVPQRFRLKTAVDRSRGGRAQDAMLFGYESLPAGSVWLARIDVDADVSPNATTLLRRALDQTVLWLGRSRGAEYGRTRATLVAAPPAMSPDPAGSTQEIRVHCVSDLLLTDKVTGLPVLLPSPSTFGLPADWHYAAGSSDIATCRYSPFHGRRKKRDEELHAIKRGSVLCFRGATAVDREAIRRSALCGVGSRRFDGFGMVRIDPWYLWCETVDCVATDDVQAPRTVPQHPLAAWMSARAADTVAEAETLRDARAHSKDLSSWQRKLDRRPSPSQWNRVAGYAAEALRAPTPDPAALRARLDAEVFGTSAGIASNDWRSERDRTTLAGKLTALLATGSPRVAIMRLLLTARLVARTLCQTRKQEEAS